MDDYTALLGKEVYGVDEEKIGTVDALYVTENSEKPMFITVKTGWFSGSSFIPLAQADVMDDRIVVPYDKDKVKDAPNIEADEKLSPDEEERLYDYYDGEEQHSADDERAFAGHDHDHDDDDDDHDHDHAVGHDTSGPTTDDAMTRSEEEVNAGTERHESGRYRLRKYVVTDTVTKQVPVQREEVRVERQPINSDNLDNAMEGPELSDEEHEVVTYAEKPVVDKTVVPKERVQMTKDTVQDKQTVTEDVRKEQIDVDTDDDDDRR